MSEPPDHVRLNRGYWDEEAKDYADPGRLAWAKTEPSWGIWGVADSELNVLPDVSGSDVIELGCGTAYFSSWLARRGARVVGLDNSAKQLASAQRYQREFGVDFPLIHGNAEEVPLAHSRRRVDFTGGCEGGSRAAQPRSGISASTRIARPRALRTGRSWRRDLAAPRQPASAERRCAKSPTTGC